MDKALQRYLRWHRSAGHSPKTIRHHSTTIDLFIRWCKAKGYSTEIDNLTADTIREWIEDQRSRGLSDHTIATRIRSLRAWTHWLTEEEWLDRDPLRRLKVPKADDKAKEVLCPDDVDRLLATCDKKTNTGRRDYAIMLLLFSTGLRATEITNLQVEDVDWVRGLIVVRRGKGGKFRMVPLGPKVERALDRYLDGRATGPLFLTDDDQHMTFYALRELLRRHGKKAGIHANPHKWRHSAAIQYLRSGGRVEALRAMLGHSTVDMTLHYARITGTDLAEAHQTVDPTKALKSR
jgi:integrase/recombinase XerD